LSTPVCKLDNVPLNLSNNVTGQIPVRANDERSIVPIEPKEHGTMPTDGRNYFSHDFIREGTPKAAEMHGTPQPIAVRVLSAVGTDRLRT
jgi:hypothetical protein